MGDRAGFAEPTEWHLRLDCGPDLRVVSVGCRTTGGIYETAERLAIGEVGNASDNFDCATQFLEFGHEIVGGVADNEVMAASG
jgi:hypothetical protein